MSTWQSAHEALQTDWTNERAWDRRDRPQPVARLDCGLTNSKGKPCVAMFFNEEGRQLHHVEDHSFNPLPKAPPEVKAVKPPRTRCEPEYVWRPNVLSGEMQKVRVR